MGYIVVLMVIVKFCRYVLIRSWCYWWGHIRFCSLGCAVHKPTGVHSVFHILCAPDIVVLNGVLFVQYMAFGMYYTQVYRCRSFHVPEYYWPVLILWVVGIGTLEGELVHLVGFYYKNISRCTILWMSSFYCLQIVMLDWQPLFLIL